jgi:UDP-glucose 4-epimerase
MPCPPMARILVTGGAGYIGSHTVLELLLAGHAVTVVDNLVNSTPAALERVAALAGRSAQLEIADLCDQAAITRIVAAARPDAVIHFAGLKAVGESVQQPLRYYGNNLTGTLHLLDAMRAAGCRRLVFSSSATVYGGGAPPFAEDAPLDATNPYGRTKLFIEHMCRDLALAEPGWSLILLRYFNPVGAHPSGRIGEDPQGPPNNLMPFVLQVAVGRRPHVSVFGTDWPTPDGTGVRDYIHVVDLARGHLAALDALPRLPGCTAINLGTGRGQSVLELIAGVGAAAGRPVPWVAAPRRSGDVASSVADPGRARDLLGWTAQYDLQAMCTDAWRWQSGNPDGYASPGKNR